MRTASGGGGVLNSSRRTEVTPRGDRVQQRVEVLYAEADRG